MIATWDHPRLGPVTLSQTRRARRIAICVRASGAVRVSFPCGVSQRRAQAFVEEKIEWIERTRERLAVRRADPAPELAPEERKRRIEALRRAAKADLPERIARIAAQTGLRYGKMTVRASRTKWGSCTGRNDISLSLSLMKLPERLRDYVIVHELCHTVHHDHSPQFHALVDRLLGGRERELMRELRRYTAEP